MTNIISCLGNSQKLDGGAMFGHVPKALWCTWITPDAENRIPLACRALLIQDGEKNILLEAGIGSFFSPNLRERYGVVEENHVLLDSLKSIGLSHEDIDFVILSHLHFDHAGGLLSAWQENTASTLLFPKARYVVSKAGWERALHPHLRDRASFVPELNTLLEKSNRLLILDKEHCDLLGDHYQFQYSDGHTVGLMHTIINLPNEAPIVFASDLIPGTPWVHLPVCMGYDRAPEQLVEEKRNLLNWVINHDARLFYTHDHQVAMSQVIQDENKKFAPIHMVGEFKL